VVAALLAAAGCGHGADTSAGQRDPHAKVACVGCHRGRPTPSGRSGVPDVACTPSGCHPNGGPDTARIAMVTFLHSAHPMSTERSVPCAACHTHRSGSTILQADSSTCALCHFRQVSGIRDAGCATCHPSPRHTMMSSQGVPLPHEMLKDAHVPCTRCHYRVVQGDTTVVGGRGATCHAERPPSRLPSADSAHALHPELSCRSCHSPVVHRVVAMSGAIALDCLDCHDRRHRPALPVDTSRTAKCDDCHAGVHAEQQRLIIGVMPGEELGPSLMFMGGVTCRSCHVTPEAPRPRAGASLLPSGDVCVGCHGGAWAGVLARWNRGYQRRRAWIDGYLQTADSSLQAGRAPASALAKLAQARGLMAFVRRAGPSHNLAAADRIMREALVLGSDAYRISGRAVPPPPVLGPAVKPGSCVSCHYGIEEAPAGRDSATGRTITHAAHMFRAFLPCDACHAAGAPPPGIPDSLWIDTLRAGAMAGGGAPPDRRP
jgi:hypothetical protein